MRIEKLDNTGRGITYHEGIITFVENALPNEEVELIITQEHKTFKTATATNIANQSPNRTIPKCPYYHDCGGCNLLHINAEYEDEYKENKVEEILKKYAGIESQIKYIKNDKELFYRNKISLKIENYEWGYYNAATHKLCPVKACLIASNAINCFLENNKAFKIPNGSITIRSNYKDELMLIINSSDAVDIDFSAIPSNICGIIVNSKTIYGDNFFFDSIGDMLFRLSYDSFFQVNNYMASCIFNILRNNLHGKNVLDLYCGVGTLGLALKDNYKNIYGIEKVKNAIIDAKYNAKLNNVTNAFYYAGDTAKVLKHLDKSFDTIIVDPPRSGLNKDTLDIIINIHPKNIAYISCDPMTLARDLKILKEHYYVFKTNVLCMFPNTYHVECVIVLNRK